MDVLTQERWPRLPVGMHWGRMAARLALGLVWTASVSASLFAQGAEEYELKAAFLYKFARFVEWPAEYNAGPVCIGVVGKDPFGDALDRVVEGKSINGRPFLVRRFKPERVSGSCHIVFIGASEKNRLPAILHRLQTGPVLTVGEVPDFCESGGIINLELVNDRISMQVNLQAAEKVGLQLSSKLLSVAKIVRQAGQ